MGEGRITLAEAARFETFALHSGHRHRWIRACTGGGRHRSCDIRFRHNEEVHPPESRRELHSARWVRQVPLRIRLNCLRGELRIGAASYVHRRSPGVIPVWLPPCPTPNLDLGLPLPSSRRSLAIWSWCAARRGCTRESAGWMYPRRRGASRFWPCVLCRSACCDSFPRGRRGLARQLGAF